MAKPLYGVRIIKEAEHDAAWAYFSEPDDAKALQAFIEPACRLGWWPPDDDPSQAALEANEFRVFVEAEPHVFGFDFRGGRVPFITVLFWVDELSKRIYVAHVVETKILERRTAAVLTVARRRIQQHQAAIGWKEKP